MAVFKTGCERGKSRHAAYPAYLRCLLFIESIRLWWNLFPLQLRRKYERVELFHRGKMSFIYGFLLFNSNFSSTQTLTLNILSKSMFYWGENDSRLCLRAETAQPAGEEVEGGQHPPTVSNFSHTILHWATLSRLSPPASPRLDPGLDGNVSCPCPQQRSLEVSLARCFCLWVQSPASGRHLRVPGVLRGLDGKQSVELVLF